MGYGKKPRWVEFCPGDSPLAWCAGAHRRAVRPGPEGLEGTWAASLQRAWVWGDPVHSYSACKNIPKWFEALPCAIQSKVIEISDKCDLPSVPMYGIAHCADLYQLV